MCIYIYMQQVEWLLSRVPIQEKHIVYLSDNIVYMWFSI